MMFLYIIQQITLLPLLYYCIQLSHIFNHQLTLYILYIPYNNTMLPVTGLMDMMKNMYEEGDENMKKVIGEAMLKSQRGERPEPPSMDMNSDF